MKKLFLDLDGTLARFNVRNALERFAIEEGFFANLLPYKNISRVNEIAASATNEVEIYIISASPNERADEDKMIWIEKHIPNIKVENRLICRIGENKAEYLKSRGIEIDAESFLLDDYTRNLTEWENARRYRNKKNNTLRG